MPEKLQKEKRKIKDNKKETVRWMVSFCFFKKEKNGKERKFKD